MQKNIIHLLLFIMLSFIFQGCGGTLVVLSTAITGLMTVQEVDEEYDGDVQYYIEDKATSAYEYIESKTSD
jgi:hypothetical protein